MVVPAHLSKGLEFDGVILADAGSARFSDSLMDAKLLYVALTRAMHILDIHCIGAPSPLLEGLPVERVLDDARGMLSNAPVKPLSFDMGI